MTADDRPQTADRHGGTMAYKFEKLEVWQKEAL